MPVRSSHQFCLSALMEEIVTISREAIFHWLKVYSDTIIANNDYLTELDAAIGDADHGANILRGFQIVLTQLPLVADKDIGSILKQVARGSSHAVRLAPAIKRWSIPCCQPRLPTKRLSKAVLT